MKWTAALHPDFAGEIGSLPEPARHSLLILILEQQLFGPYSPDKINWCFTEDDYPYCDRFFRLGSSLTASLEGRAMAEGFLYLHVGSGSDEEIQKISAQRLRDHYDKNVQSINFNDYFDSLPYEEQCAANDIIGRMATRGILRFTILDLMKDAREETARFLNFTPRQMLTFEARIDHYFTVINQHLSSQNIKLRLTYNCSGPDLFETAAFKDLEKIK